MSDQDSTIRKLAVGPGSGSGPADADRPPVSELVEASGATLTMTSDEPTVDAFGATVVGRKRDANEDQYLVAELSKSMLIHQTSLAHADHQRLIGGAQGKLFIVADGMGGHAGGNVASSVAVDTVARSILNMMPWFFGLTESREDDLVEELKSVLKRCQKSVDRAAEGHPGHSRMGTTLTMAYVLWPRLYVVHAGDNRCYLVRGPEIEQITRDHTIAQRLVDQDVLSAEKAARTKWSSILWNAIGGGEGTVAPEAYRGKLQGATRCFCARMVSRLIWMRRPSPASWKRSRRAPRRQPKLSWRGRTAKAGGTTSRSWSLGFTEEDCTCSSATTRQAWP